MPGDNTQQEKPTLNGRYLYAVVPTQVVDKLNLNTPGIHGADVHPVVAGKLAAIVSDIEPETLRPERKHLAAHSAVLRQVMDEATMLPVAFGIIANSEREVRELLAEHESDFLEQLRGLTGQVEMGLRGWLRDPNVFEYFVNTFPDLRAMRDDLYSRGEPSREQKIELGKYFTEELNRFRKETADKVLRDLEPVSTKTRVNEPRTEAEVLNLAVLVPREKVDALTKAVEAQASKLPDNFQLDMTGPWPPYNFVNLRIHLEKEEEAEAREAP